MLFTKFESFSSLFHFAFLVFHFMQKLNKQWLTHFCDFIKVNYFWFHDSLDNFHFCEFHVYDYEKYGFVMQLLYLMQNLSR